MPTFPNYACLQDDILVFGGTGGREKQPEYVSSDWSIASEFLNEKKGSVSLFLTGIVTKPLPFA